MSGFATRLARHPFATLIPLLLVTFLVLFPKGGVKVGPIPLTWGYFALGLSVVALGVVRVVKLPARGKLRSLAVLASLLPFQILFLYSGLANGIAEMGYAVGLFVNFFVLPVAFLMIYPAFFARIDGDYLARILRFCIFWAAVYGIFLFFWHPLTGYYIEIPYLTVNADDYGLIEATKHISRGLFYKLISTYNNGNVYGVATLILLPIYEAGETRRWRRIVLKVALILTLSRSVWFGLIVDQMLSLVRLGAESIGSFPVIRMGPAVRRGLVILGTIGMVLIGLVFTSQNLAFLFDKDLGGRLTVLGSISAPTWLPSMPIEPLSEIVYASALVEYGRLGCVAIVLIFTFPLVLFLLDTRILTSHVRTAALKGMTIYMIVACLDGAINFIPVMAFYWFAYMIFLEGWPAAHAPMSAPMESPRAVRAASSPVFE